MTAEPDTIDVETDIEDAIDWLNATGYRHLPVTENDRLVGIVSIKDLLWATTGSVVRVRRIFRRTGPPGPTRQLPTRLPRDGDGGPGRSRLGEAKSSTAGWGRGSARQGGGGRPALAPHELLGDGCAGFVARHRRPSTVSAARGGPECRARGDGALGAEGQRQRVGREDPPSRCRRVAP
ncbi:MAG: CBS domain-containing protein [Acidimicrobiia bacterium]